MQGQRTFPKQQINGNIQKANTETWHKTTSQNTSIVGETQGRTLTGLVDHKTSNINYTSLPIRASDYGKDHSSKDSTQDRCYYNPLSIVY
jgi:hypothetical protein